MKIISDVREMKQIVHLAAMLLVFMCGGNCNSLAVSAAASAYLLSIERSEGRSQRYWADHPLYVVDTNAEHAVVVVHGVSGGMKGGAEILVPSIMDRGDRYNVERLLF